VGVVLAFLRLLNFFLPVHFIGPLILSMLRMYQPIGYFILLLCVILLGFSGAFCLMYGGYQIEYSSGFGMALYTIVNVIYSQQIFVDNDQFVPLPIHWFGDIFMFLYYILSAILLVNLLIAMMSSEFNDLMEGKLISERRIEGEWSQEMGTLLLHYERFPFLPTPFNIIQIIVLLIAIPIRYCDDQKWKSFVWNFLPGWTPRDRITWQLYWEEQKNQVLFFAPKNYIMREVHKQLKGKEKEIWKTIHDQELVEVDDQEVPDDDESSESSDEEELDEEEKQTQQEQESESGEGCCAAIMKLCEPKKDSDYLLLDNLEEKPQEE